MTDDIPGRSPGLKMKGNDSAPPQITHHYKGKRRASPARLRKPDGPLRRAGEQEAHPRPRPATARFFLPPPSGELPTTRRGGFMRCASMTNDETRMTDGEYAWWGVGGRTPSLLLAQRVAVGYCRAARFTLTG